MPKELVHISGFFIAVIIIYEAFGKKATEYFLMLVILSMLVINADKIKELGSELVK